MNSKLIYEIAKQKGLINVLVENTGGGNKYLKAVEEIFGLSGVKRIPQGRGAVSTLGGGRIDVIRDIYESFPAKPKFVDNTTTPPREREISLDEFAAEMKKNSSDPTRLVKEAEAKRFVEHIEKEIFTNSTYTKSIGGEPPLADVIIDAMFNAKGTSIEVRAKYATLRYYAEEGDQAGMLRTKKDLQTGCSGGCLPDSWIKYAESKYVKQVENEIVDEPGFFKKFAQGIKAAGGDAKWGKSYVDSIPVDKTNELMTRFFAIARAIQNSLETPGGKYDFTNEIFEMNEIATQIAKIKDENLKNLWVQWRDQMPDFMQQRIKDPANDDLFIKYVRFFEENSGYYKATSDAPVLGRPEYRITRIRAFLRVFNDPEVSGFGAQLKRGLYRAGRFLLLGDFRTYREIKQIRKTLKGSKTREIAYIATERAISYLIYYPIAMSFFNTVFDFTFSRFGYKEKEIDDPQNPGKKIKVKVPNFDMGGLADPEQFFKNEKAGAEAFFDVWLDNMIGEFSMTGEHVAGGKFISPLIATASKLTFDYHKAKKFNITPDNTDQPPPPPPPTDTTGNANRLWEPIKAEISRNTGVSQDTLDQLIRSGNLNPGDREILIKLKDKIDSLRQTGVWQKTDEVLKVDDINF